MQKISVKHLFWIFIVAALVIPLAGCIFYHRSRHIYRERVVEYPAPVIVVHDDHHDDYRGYHFEHEGDHDRR